MLFLALVFALLVGTFFAWSFMRMVINDHAMAMLSLRLHRLLAMSTGITTLHPKHLRTRDDQNGQRGEDAFAESGHATR